MSGLAEGQLTDLNPEFAEGDGVSVNPGIELANRYERITSSAINPPQITANQSIAN